MTIKSRPCYLMAILCLLLYACSDDDEVQITIEGEDFSTSISENPENDTSIGTLSATSNSNQDISFELVNQSVEDAIVISSEGLITVGDTTVFDFEINTVITATAMATVEGVSDEIAIQIAITDVDESVESPSPNIWTGPKIIFEKEAGSDPTLEENQDRITDNVWITRGNSGGEIYNAVLEESSTQNVSPMGTEWALGTTADLASLTFDSFRGTISPSQVVGEDMVLHLIEDDIYIDIKFLSWNGGGRQGNGGAFSYERSTE